MTLASDQNNNQKTLTPVAQKILDLREAVFAEWETRVRSSIKQTRELSHPILIDTLPAFYDDIAQAVSEEHSKIDLDSTSVANEHGGERARLTKYDFQALINEYQILRWTMFDVLHQNGVPLTHQETIIINASLDAGIREAVQAFSLVHSALRERFLAALTHDMRDPLAAAKLAVELIMVSTEPAKMKLYAAKVDENLNRISGMIHQLLDSMMFEKGERQKLDITNFDILEVAKEVQIGFVALHGARFQVLGDSVRGWWDREALRRVIENLAGNAVKYGNPDKLIRIKIKETHERLLLSVHNEGQPIPLEEQEDIFQIFRRAQLAKEGKKDGWGVGLPFVRGIAEAHGGSIGLDSTIERGTTFIIDIPVDSRPYQDAPAFG